MIYVEKEKKKKRSYAEQIVERKVNQTYSTSIFSKYIQSLTNLDTFVDCLQTLYVIILAPFEFCYSHQSQ